MMETRKIAIYVGALYILGTVFGILSAVLTAPLFTDTAYLVKVFENQNQIKLGSLCVLLMGISLAFIPIILFPTLKKANEILALGYMVFRGALETVTYVMTAVSFLLLVVLSQQLPNAGANTAFIIAQSDVVKAIAHLPLTVFIFSIGAFMLYLIFYKSQLIPRWLSMFGFVAIALHFLTGILLLFNFQTEESIWNTIMNLPIFLQEMVMAVWLIARGFSVKTMDVQAFGAPAQKVKP